jgi:hypothetical protein
VAEEDANRESDQSSDQHAFGRKLNVLDQTNRNAIRPAPVERIEEPTDDVGER